MMHLMARGLRWLGRACAQLADDLDPPHEHTWFFHVGTYGRQTCITCRYTELWRPKATTTTPAPGDTGVAYFRGFVDTEWDEFGHEYGH